VKTVILTILFLFNFSILSSQIPNGDFENWINGGLPGWSLDLTGKFHKLSYLSHSGNYALLCKTYTYTAGNYVFWNAATESTNGNYYIPLTGKPTGLYGWYLLNGNPIDSMHVTVSMKSKGQVIGGGKFFSNSKTANYQSFYLPISYSSTNVPDSFSIFCGLKHASSSLTAVYFDDFSLDFATGISEEKSNFESPRLHIYNNQLIKINYPVDYIFSESEVELYDMLGSSILKFSYSKSPADDVDIPILDSGIYILTYREKHCNISKKIFVN
jgi:hypothetical protein